MSCEIVNIGNTKYDLLTIGNITKICSDKILFDHEGNISVLQWFTFQLEYLFLRMGLPTIDKITGYKFSRMQMHSILKKLYNCNVPIDDKIDIDNNGWKKNGLISENIKNRFTNLNIGGYPLFSLKINDLKTDIIFPDNENLFGDKPSISETYDTSKSDEVISEKSVIVPHKKHTIKISKKSKNITSKSVFTNLKNPSQRVLNSIGSAKKYTDKCLSKGKLEWNRNSCFADSIIILLIYRILEKDNLYISKLFNNQTYTKEFLEQNLALLCPEKNIDESLLAYNNIFDVFRDILKRIEKGEILDLQKFLYSLRKCPLLGAQDYANGGTHDSAEFLNTMLRYFSASYIDTNKQTVYYFKHGNTNLDSIKSKHNFFFDTVIPLKDGLGNNFMDKIDEKAINDAKIQIHNISGEQLTHLYKKIVVSDKRTEREITKDKKQFVYDALLDKVISIKEKPLVQINKSTINMHSQKLISSKTVTEATGYSYHMINKDYEYEETGDGFVFYHKNDRDNIENWKMIDELTPDIGFRYSSIVTNHTLVDNTEDIFITLDRKIARIFDEKLYNATIDVKIIPDQMIDIGDSVYTLYAIVVWVSNHYISFFRCNNKYYLYDDMYDTDILDDYISEIGDFEELLKYAYRGVSNIVQKNSRILYYTKQ